MAQFTFNSAGVSLNEIDLSAPSKVTPTGVPAAIIGTANRGPAFVPITVATFQDFIANFGNSDGAKFGPLAVREWLKNAGSATYVRVLGAGDGNQRTTSGINKGKVTSAGFVVGNQSIQAGGNYGANVYNGTVGTSAPLGRTYFLIAMMSESAGSTYFSDAGIQTKGQNIAVPIIRGILMAPSGVVLSLSASVSGVVNNTPSTTGSAFSSFGAGSVGNAGANIGTVVTSSAQSKFVMLLNGLKNNDVGGKNVITASFSPNDPSYFVNAFNTDPLKIESKGHFLYAHYDVRDAFAIVTGTGYTQSYTDAAAGGGGLFALLLTSSLSRNSGSSTTSTAVGVPNFEGFEDRYSEAVSPYVISQQFGGSNKNLFRFHSRTDGAASSVEIKVTISNVQKNANPAAQYGSFDVLIRKFSDADDGDAKALETYNGVNLDPTSPDYIAKRIGDSRSFFDFDQPTGRQRLVVEGDYPNKSQYVWVELSDALKNGDIDPTALPTGFRGVSHLVTKGNSINGAGNILTGSLVSQDPTVPSGPANAARFSNSTLQSVVQPPIPMRLSVAKESPAVAKKTLSWGVQYELNDSLTQPNQNALIDSSIVSFLKYFPTYHTDFQNPQVGNNAEVSDIGTTVFDSDRFNNNKFTMERIEVITGSNDRPDPNEWVNARYRRNGILSGSIQATDGTWRPTRFFDPTKDFGYSANFGFHKFTLPMLGGFNGVNIFNSDQSNLTNNAALREMANVASQGGVNGPTVAAYRKALDVLQNKTNADIQLLAIPGIRDPGVTDYAISAVENRFDAMYVMDMVQYDELNTVITGTVGGVSTVNLQNTVSNLLSRGLNTSFAATYFPDVQVKDPAVGKNVVVPPSVVVLGSYALNDTFAPWFAPAGTTRGALPTTLELDYQLNQTQDLDTLYAADINPIVRFQGGAPIVWGNKTLYAAQSSLDRINVRRLLIEVRRRVRQVANTFIFEPNRASTLAAFSAKVNPILSQIQQGQGIEKFSVKIDTTTTTQADVENNTVRGKIYIVPTKTTEFISVDFVVTNQGAQV